MSPRAEELLYFMMWTAEAFFRPTYSTWNDSFENWAHRNHLTKRLAELEREKLITRVRGPDPSERIYQLTEAGRLGALGGQNPEERWARPWDGRWRLVLFDLPGTNRALRFRLWRFLRRHRFGYLQNSVWISPDSLEDLQSLVADRGKEVESLTFMEARPEGGATDRDLVAGAWDFSKINDLYRQHADVLAAIPTTKRLNHSGDDRWRRWAEHERRTWSEALALDPLLPAALLPAGYLGQKAWHERRRVLRSLTPRFSSATSR